MLTSASLMCRGGCLLPGSHVWLLMERWVGLSSFGGRRKGPPLTFYVYDMSSRLKRFLFKLLTPKGC